MLGYASLTTGKLETEPRALLMLRTHSLPLRRVAPSPSSVRFSFRNSQGVDMYTCIYNHLYESSRTYQVPGREAEGVL